MFVFADSSISSLVVPTGGSRPAAGGEVKSDLSLWRLNQYLSSFCYSTFCLSFIHRALSVFLPSQFPCSLTFCCLNVSGLFICRSGRVCNIWFVRFASFIPLCLSRFISFRFTGDLRRCPLLFIAEYKWCKAKLFLGVYSVKPYRNG